MLNSVAQGVSLRVLINHLRPLPAAMRVGRAQGPALSGLAGVLPRAAWRQARIGVAGGARTQKDEKLSLRSEQELVKRRVWNEKREATGWFLGAKKMTTCVWSSIRVSSNKGKVQDCHPRIRSGPPASGMNQVVTTHRFSFSCLTHARWELLRRSIA